MFAHYMEKVKGPALQCSLLDFENYLRVVKVWVVHIATGTIIHNGSRQHCADTCLGRAVILPKAHSHNPTHISQQD